MSEAGALLLQLGTCNSGGNQSDKDNKLSQNATSDSRKKLEEYVRQNKSRLMFGDGPFKGVSLADAELVGYKEVKNPDGTVSQALTFLHGLVIYKLPNVQSLIFEAPKATKRQLALELYGLQNSAITSFANSNSTASGSGSVSSGSKKSSMGEREKKVEEQLESLSRTAELLCQPAGSKDTASKGRKALEDKMDEVREELQRAQDERDRDWQ